MLKLPRLAAGAAGAVFSAMAFSAGAAPNYSDIQTVVVIYAENRSFDSLFGQYPSANGLSHASSTSYTQLDRDGSTLASLPSVWGGTNGNSGPVVTNAKITTGAPPAPTPVTETQTEAYFSSAGINHPFSLLSLYNYESSSDTDPLAYTNRDLYHRFYENQMQINGGANNMYAAWADSGGLTMMYIPNNVNDHPLWTLARQNTLADNFFQSAYGGSYLNHQYLICSCAPVYPGNASSGPVNPTTGGSAPSPSTVTLVSNSYINNVWTLTPSGSSPASAMNGPPSFVASTVITPAMSGIFSGDSAGVFYSVNTSQPPFPPSSNATNTSGPQTTVNLKLSNTVPPQTQTTIGDLLTRAGVNWAWYSGAFNYALNNPPNTPGSSAANPNFQYHHQPFNFYGRFDPARPAGYDDGGNPSTDPIYAQSGAAERAQHLLDAGIATAPYTTLPAAQVGPATAPWTSSQFVADIQSGNLPPVTFYKPQGTVNEHNGYANVTDGDQHIAAVVAALEASPQWSHMLIVITYDEFGGIWDHVAPPTGDFFGPGTRIPAIIISPYAKHGYVDHTQYDTTSILRFITNRWSLPTLSGITLRDTSLQANGRPAMGDLTNALVLP
jgi:phospholipase C